MKLPSTSPLAITGICVALLIGGTGGAIAAGQIGTNDIRNGAVTTAKLHKNAVTSHKIHNRSVKTADLAPSARGAKVVQYIASGALLDTQNSLTVQLPGTDWTAEKIAKSSWSVELVRNSGPILFVLGNSAPAGEGTADGFYVTIDSGVASVFVNAPSYSLIDTVRVTRTISTSQVDGTLARTGGPKASTQR
jgi:hypothetical protein